MEVNTLRLGGGVRLEVASLSDVGCVRANNEDSLGVYAAKGTQGPLLIVADGMGGAAAGEVASGLAVETVHRSFFESEDASIRGDALRQSVRNANRAVFERASADPNLHGMGTTCTAVSFPENGMIIAHIGDSRAYLASGDALVMLTRDHTLAAELAKHPTASSDTIPREAHNILTRCLGVDRDVFVDLDIHAHYALGDTLLLCSDGLTGMIDEETILDLLTGNDPAEACRRLVEAAKEGGGLDNVTVIVGRFVAENGSD